LGEKFADALLVAGVAHVEGWMLHSWMAEQQAREFKACIPGDTYDGDLAGISH
jgi:hypothetical protein